MSSSSADPIEILAGAFRDKQPLVLFAGQNLDSAHEPVVEALLDHLGGTDGDSGWRAAIGRGLSASDMAWLAGRFDRSVPSEAAATIFEVAWSAVFTSSIDPRFVRRFETRGRQPEAVLSRGVYARVPRSRSRPPVHYLFGKCDESVEDARSPLKHIELTRRSSRHATELLNRIAETATVHGVVVIAGYDPRTDWMPLDSLLAPLSDQSDPRILWFGHIDPEGDSSIAEEMIKQGSLITTKTTLASAISQLELRGVIDVAGSAAPDDPGMVSLSEEVALDITAALRLRVEASAAIVDDGWTQEPEPMDDSEAYDAFRRFHSTLGNFRLLVEGVSRGFAVEREFERTLWNTVKNKLKRLGQPDPDDVIILHGQSGTGKSIALARLAHKIRRELCLPVLVATNRLPNPADIEAFCAESERLGAQTTVLISDSGQTPSRYDDVTSALRSRGRRLLVVGTSYRVKTGTSKSDRFVEAPAEVTQAELSVLEKLQSKFRIAPSYGPNTTDSIFALLYRRLPAARGRLAAGMSTEAMAAEDSIRDRASEVPQPSTGRSVMAEQLIELGILSRSSPVFEEDEKLAVLGLDAACRLIDYVMVVGRLGRAVPVNLVFRALGQTGGLHQDQITYLLADLDLFQWRDDEEGTDFLIAPRIQLEAELLCRRRLTPEEEIDRLLDLIGSVRLGLDRSAERSFLLDLLFMLDRNGPRQEAYRLGYLRFADAIKRLREHHRISDADLALRESVLRRRVVRQGDRKSTTTIDERLAILDQARDTVEGTLRAIEEGEIRVSRKTKQSLIGERSAIYGYLATQHAESGSGEDFWADYLAARTASEKAVGIGRNLHPIDIALWTGRNVLNYRRGKLSDAQCVEIETDLYAVIDVGDDIFGIKRQGIRMPNASHEDSDPDDSVTVDQRTRYLESRESAAAVLRDIGLRDETLGKLESVAPAAATFLIARRRAEQVYSSDPPFDAQTRESAREAADYIDHRVNGGISLDLRCRRLLLNLRWAQATGERLLFRRRGQTPVDKGLILCIHEVVSTLNEQAGIDARDRERFLEAVLCWLLGRMSRALEIWQSLSSDTDREERLRVERWLVTTDEGGSPCRFRGRVERKGENYWVRVEGIDRTIWVSARDFPNEDLAHGRELRNFGIAFNYIGPCAERLSRPVGRP